MRQRLPRIVGAPKLMTGLKDALAVVRHSPA
jgi:hypothetical protein